MDGAAPAGRSNRPPRSRARRNCTRLWPFWRLTSSQLDYLYERLLAVGTGRVPDSCGICWPSIGRNCLAGCGRTRRSAESEERRFRAAAALAAYEPVNPGWHAIRDDVAQSLTRVKPEFLGDWKEALRPVRAELLGPLGAIFRNHELGELQQALATSTLADYVADDVHLLADLLEDAEPRQFAELFPVLARHGDAAISGLECELDTVARPQWIDAPPDAAWRDVAAEVRYAIEAAAGTVEERFAVCQTMPYVRFCDVVEQLRRLRLSSATNPTVPCWFLGHGGRGVDTRRPILAMAGRGRCRTASTRDSDLRREGYVPIDVFGGPLGRWVSASLHSRLGASRRR